MLQKLRHLSWQFVLWKRCFAKLKFTALEVFSAEYLEHVVDNTASNSVLKEDMDPSRKHVYSVAAEFPQMKPTSSRTRISLIVPNLTVPNN